MLMFRFGCRKAMVLPGVVRGRRALAIGACALLCTACHRGPSSDASQIVAAVNSEEISVHQINQALQRTPGVTPERADAAGRAVLDRLVEQQLAVQGALALKLDRDNQTMQLLSAARREVLARAWALRVADQAAKPTAAAVAAFYAARPDLYAQRRIYELQEFVVQADASEMEALRERLKTARSVADVTDHLRSRQLPVRAQLTTQAAEALAPALLQRLVAMRDGQAMLLAAPGGARVIYRAASQSAPLSLQQVQADIAQTLLAEARYAAVQTALAAQKQGSQIRYFGRFASSGSAASAAPAASDGPAAFDAGAAAAALAAPAAAAMAASAGELLRPQGEITPTDPVTLRRGLSGLK